MAWIENTMIVSGGSPTPTEAIWYPHWGVNLADYEVSGKIAILARNDVLSKFRCDTSTGDWRISVIGSAGVERTIDTADNTYYELDLSADANAFPDPIAIGNGYDTFVLLIEALTGNITTFQSTNPSNIYSATSGSQTGFLWLVSDLSVFYDLRYNLFLEYNDVPNTAYVYLDSCFGLICSGGINSANSSGSSGNATLQSCLSLKKFVNINTGTGSGNTLFEAFSGCYNLESSVSGTYTTITQFNGTFNNCRKLKEINITAPSTLWSVTNLWSCKTLILTMPLTSFTTNEAYNLQTLTLINTNFKSLASTTNAISLNNLRMISSSGLTSFLTNLEDLTGYVAQNIRLFSGVTNWDATHTALANSKNWNIIP